MLGCLRCQSHTLTREQGYGVYRFAKKYGANVDGYSPIYTPDAWSQNGGNYSLGFKGLLAWCVLLCWTARLGKRTGVSAALAIANLVQVCILPCSS